LNTPVLLLVYNRLNTVKRLLDVINDVKPPRLYISGDGPKRRNAKDKEKVLAVRKYLLNNLNPDIEVHTRFNTRNLGSKYTVHKAIQWFYVQEERGIILEDDCLPVNFFFEYCEDLLERYQNDKNIGMITGRNEFGRYKNALNGDYFLSTRAFVWGWATWRDRIEDFDIEIFDKLNFKDMITVFRNVSTFLEFIYRRKTILDVKEQRVDAWDYQWSVTLLLNRQYTIVPKQNMVINLGFGDDATHTNHQSEDSVTYVWKGNKINHPEKLEIDKSYSNKTIIKESVNIWYMLIPRFLKKLVGRFK
jgi:hypothetical protein